MQRRSRWLILGACVLLGGGFWFFRGRSPSNIATSYAAPAAEQVADGAPRVSLVSLTPVPASLRLEDRFPDPAVAQVIWNAVGTPADGLTPTHLATLTELNLKGSGATSLAGLEACTKLERLTLDRCPIADLTPLADLPALESLSMRRCESLQSLEGLSALTNLRDLDIAGAMVPDESWPVPRPTAPLAALTKLERLVLDGIPLDSLEFLKSMPSLHTLNYDNSGYGPPAFDPIGSVTSLKHLSLQNSSFESSAFLKTLVNLEHLDLSSNVMMDWVGLPAAPHLRFLDLDGGNEPSDLSILRRYPELRVLRLSPYVLDGEFALDGIETCMELEVFWAPWAEITSVEPLSQCKHLRELDLRGNPIVDVAPLASLPNLTHLQLQFMDNAPDLSPLRGLPSLREVVLRSSGLTDATLVASWTQVEVLDLSFNQFLRDLTPLAALSQLRELRVSRCAIDDVAPLASCRGLEILDVGDNYGLSDLTSLHDLKGMREFYGRNCAFQSLDSFSHWPELEVLNVPNSTMSQGSNRFADLTPLSGLSRLTILALGESSVAKDLSPLSGLTELCALDLYDTQVTDLTPLASLTNLKFLDIRWNPLSDVSALASLTSLSLLRASSAPLTDLLPLANNPGLGEGDLIELDVSTLNGDSQTRLKPQLEARGVGFTEPCYNCTRGFTDPCTGASWIE